MLFQASKVIWSLLLLNIGLCLAMRGIIPAPPNEAGVRIASASCRGNQYSSMVVHKTIRDRLQAMYQQGQFAGDLIEYHPKQNEDLRINGPYFSTYIGSDKTDNQRDMVVFTGNGRLVKVISQVWDENKWTVEDCRHAPELVISPMMPNGYLQ